MATAPGQQFADWTNVPGIMDTFNAAKKGNPSAGSMVLGYGLTKLAPSSSIGQTMLGNAPPQGGMSPVVPPGQADTTQIPYAPTDQTSAAPSIADSFIGSFNNNHPLFQSILKLAN